VSDIDSLALALGAGAGGRHTRELAGDIARPDRGLTLRKGKVISSSAGPPPTIELQLGGATNEDGTPATIKGVSYLSSYAPGIGHIVWVLVNGPDMLVLGHQAN
jgi:hypothetical protein